MPLGKVVMCGIVLIFVVSFGGLFFEDGDAPRWFGVAFVNVGAVILWTGGWLWFRDRVRKARKDGKI